MKKTALILCLILVAGLISIIAFAHGPRFSDNRGFYDCPVYRDTNPDLTDEQSQQIRDLRDEYYDKTIGIKTQLRDKRQELNSQINSETPDKNKISDLLKEISTLRDRLDKERIDHSLKMKKISPNASQEYSMRRYNRRPGDCSEWGNGFHGRHHRKTF
jgi:septal ring factor EnvC (AmiA/AmiB activator)